MKAGRVIEILLTASPNAEVSCAIGDSPSLMISDLFDLERISKYEAESVLTTPDDDKCCTLILKERKKLER